MNNTSLPSSTVDTATLSSPSTPNPESHAEMKWHGRMITRTIHGPFGKITTVRNDMSAFEPPRSKEDNPKHNRSVRRKRASQLAKTLEMHFGYTRKDGAKVMRVMGRHQVKAMRSRYYQQQMEGKL